jgi:nitrite reductase (NADH) small subunit
VRIGGRTIALFNLGDRFLAVDNRCPHQQGPLCDGIVTGVSVVCPLHAWKVNLERGEVERPSNGSAACVETYPIRLENGIVSIGLPGA